MTQIGSAQSHRLSDGGQIYFAEAGKGTPVVLLHGFGLDLSMWEPQWHVLASRYRALRYDLRGYGASSVPTGAYSHVEDFRQLMQVLEASPVHLVGLSMGGRYALRIAAQLPQAVRSLTLVDAALDGHRWGEAWMARWQEIAAAARSDVGRAKALWLEHDLFAPARQQPALAEALAAMVHRYSGWHFQHRDPDAVPAPPTGERLSSIKVPTLVVVGERDLDDFQSIARRLAHELPQASLRVMRNVGHLASLEDPEAFNGLLLEHMAACER